MTIVSNEDLIHLTQLAQIDIDDEQLPALGKSINEIISMVEELKTVDTTHVEPMLHPIGEQLLLRDDRVDHDIDGCDYTQSQRNAPMMEDDFYLVPKVIDQ